MVNVIRHCVFKARALHRAVCADLACDVHPDPVAREEGLWGEVPAETLGHPLCIHRYTVPPSRFVTTAIVLEVQSFYTGG